MPAPHTFAIDRSAWRENAHRVYRVYVHIPREGLDWAGRPVVDCVPAGKVIQLAQGGRWFAGQDDPHGKGHASRAAAASCALTRSGATS